MSAPTVGPCSPWTTGPDIEALPPVAAQIVTALSKGMEQGTIDTICGNAATAASEILFEVSGRIFSGACGPVTIRPLSRPTDMDTRFAWYGGLGYSTSWGYANQYDSVPGICSHYGSINPPEIDLGAYPVTSIVQVLIDGVLIPADEYELRDFRTLVRMRPTAASVPTERFGWPTGQIQDLPDTEAGTFSVTYMFGQPPSASGQLAALKLAEALAMPQLGSSTHFGARTVQIARQGVTTQVANVIDILNKKSIGIPEVDMFLLAVNPNRNMRQSRVWSPDTGRPRRQANPSISG